MWPWLRSRLLGDVLAEMATIKSIALSTRATVQENTMAADRELLTTIHAAVTALTDPVHELVSDRDRWRTRALTAEGAAATDEAEDTAAAQPIKDALDALTSKLTPVAGPEPAPAVEDVPGVVADAPDPDTQTS